MDRATNQTDRHLLIDIEIDLTLLLKWLWSVRHDFLERDYHHSYYLLEKRKKEKKKRDAYVCGSNI